MNDHQRKMARKSGNSKKHRMAYADGGMVYNTPGDQRRMDMLYPSKGSKIKAAESEMAAEKAKSDRIRAQTSASNNERVRQNQKENEAISGVKRR